MQVKLHRFASLAQATLGALYVDGRFMCFTLEDEHRDVKLAGETRIPAGTYPLALRTEGGTHEKYKLRYAEHRGMIHVRDVPNFEHVLIHVGNSERDTAGCVLVGDVAMSSGELAQSVNAYRRLYGIVSNAILSGEPVTLTVEDYA